MADINGLPSHAPSSTSWSLVRETRTPPHLGLAFCPRVMRLLPRTSGLFCRRLKFAPRWGRYSDLPAFVPNTPSVTLLRQRSAGRR